MKKILLYLLLTILTFNVFAQENDEDDELETAYNEILEDVLDDEDGDFDQERIEEEFTQWLISQPQEDTDGELLEDGVCDSCMPDDDGDEQLNPPTEISIKGSQNADGSYPTTFAINWEQPQPLDEDTPYSLSHYHVYLSKNEQSYEIFKIAANNSNIRFKNKQAADYAIQVQAVYTPNSEAQTNKASATTDVTSAYTPTIIIVTKPPDLTVDILSGQLRICVESNGYLHHQLLSEITSLNCSEMTLRDSDITMIAKFINLQSLLFTNISGATNISPLANLVYLSSLRISASPQIDVSNLNDFEALRTLSLTNMGLTKIPAINKLTHMFWLILSHNQISDTLDNLPNQVFVVYLNGNMINSCAGIANKDLSVLVLGGVTMTNLASLFDCPNKPNFTLMLLNSLNMNPIQSIDGFAGMQSLQFNNTNIEQLIGSRPINQLSLHNNQQLTAIDVIKPAQNNSSNTYPNLVPKYITFSGSNNMPCSSLYASKDLYDSLPNPLISTAITTTVNGNSKTWDNTNYGGSKRFVPPAHCQPDNISQFTVIKSPASLTYTLNWSKQGHDLWGVTTYEVRINGSEQRNIPFEFALPLSINLVSANLASFEVRACAPTVNRTTTDPQTVCSTWYNTATTLGLDKVNNLDYAWTASSSEIFELTFGYPEELTSVDSSTPDYFEIFSSFDLDNTVAIPLVNFIPGITQYTTTSINQNNFLGREFRVKACKNSTGIQPATCGISALIRVQLPAGTNQPILAMPTLLSQENDLSAGFFKFSISSISDTDYFAIVETQPVPVIGSSPVANSANKKFYSIKAQNNQASLDLIRKVNGKHYFEISACRKTPATNNLATTYCSEPLKLGYNNNDDNWKIHRTVTNTFLNNSAEDSQFGNIALQKIRGCNPDYDNHEVGVLYNNVLTGVGCFHPDYNYTSQNDRYIKYQIIWRYYTPGITPPDYFYLTKVNISNHGENIEAIDSPSQTVNFRQANNLCIHKQTAMYDVNNSNEVMPKYAKQQIVHYNENPNSPGTSNTYNTNKDCAGGIRVSTDGLWKIQACYAGIGCTAGKEIDLLSGHGGTPNGILNPDPDPAIDSIPPSATENSPENLQSGMWWNPHQAGTGWYFFWKNASTNPNANLQDQHKLLVYWVNYRFIDNVWSPVWMYSELTLQRSNNNNDQFYSGQLLYSRIDIASGEKTETGLGTISVILNQEQRQNHRAKIELNIDSAEGILTQNGINPDAAGIGGDFEVDYGSPADIIDSIIIPLENVSIRLVGINPVFSDPSTNVDTARFGTANDGDHYSGVWKYTDADAITKNDATIIMWRKHNLEMMDFFIYDAAGEPIWLQSQSCGDPCNEPLDGYFDGYTNENTEGNTFGFDGNAQYNFHTKTIGFNPLGYKQPGSWVPVEFLAAAGRQFSVNGTNNNFDEFQQAKFWFNGNFNLTDNYNNNIRSVALTLGSKGSLTSMKTMDKYANINHIGFNIQTVYNQIQYADLETGAVSTTCDPNTIGPCKLSLNWYVDDPTGQNQYLKPYYRYVGNGNNNGIVMASFAPLNSSSDYLNCSINLPTDSVVPAYVCDTLQSGTYEFQLRRLKYNAPNDYIAIAQSQVLTVNACTIVGGCNSIDNSYNPLPATDIPNDNEPSFIGPDLPENGGNNNGVIELSELPSAPELSSKVGETKGNFSVSPTGSVSYSIPVMTAPASGGFAPKVSINYSSQSSRGAMGAGWSISGYSAISRCAQTFAQDSDATTTPQVRAITFTSSDRFCVDGQRLMLADTANTYGADEVEYRTEIDSFTKYISKDNDANKVGPECFEAWHKDGSKTFYGDCDITDAGTYDDSAYVKAGSENAALMWAQSRTIDKKGNYYDNYYLSGVNSDNAVEFLFDKILYTENINIASNGTALKGSIKMIYEDMPTDDITSSVISNYPYVKSIDNPQRLKGINSSYDGDSIRYYDFSYSKEDGTTVNDAAGMALLTQIKECTTDAMAICFEPTQITWGNTTTGTMGSSSGDLNLNLPKVKYQEQLVVGKFDANGDGYEDFYYLAGGEIKVGLSTNNGSFNIINGPYLASGFNSYTGVKIADVNADGFNDFIYLGTVYLWTGIAGAYYHPVSLPTIAREFYDFDGDGLVDIVELSNNFDPFDPTVEPSLIIHTNRLDSTINNVGSYDDKLIAAFNVEPVLNIDLNVKQFYNTNAASIFKSGTETSIVVLDDIQLKQIIDINNDGIAELLLDLEVTIKCQSNHPSCANSSNLLSEPDALIFIDFVKLKAVAYLTDNNGTLSYEVQHLAGGASCEVCERQIIHEQFADITGDGQLNLCYVDIIDISTNFYKLICQAEIGYRTLHTIIDENNMIINSLIGNRRDPIGFIDFQDYDSDGYVDIMYATGHTYDNWQWNKITWDNGNIAIANWNNTGVKAGNADPGSGPGVHNYIDANLFFDIDHDGMIDQLHFDVEFAGINNTNDRPVYIHKALGASIAANPNKGKVISITSGLGESWDIEYNFMHNTDVYTRATNSINMWSSNGRNPVYDFISGMSLVRAVDHTMPSWLVNTTGESTSTSDFMAKTQYHYKNAKLEAGGRGFVGFGEYSVFDAQDRIVTTSVQRQDFPFIGSVVTNKIKILPSATPFRSITTPSVNVHIPCWVNNTCKPVIPSSNMTVAGTNNLVSATANTWEVKPTTSNLRIKFPYLKNQIVNSYEINDGNKTGSKDLTYYYDEGSTNFYGNLTKLIVDIYQGDSLTTTKTITTDNLYDDNSTNWILNRLQSSTVTHAGSPVNKIRKIAYTYNGTYKLLHKETKSATGTTKTQTKTIETRDTYGNITEVKLSATDALDSYTKTQYANGRYITKTLQKDDTTYITTNQTLQSNQYGLPLISQNAHGVKTYNSYDAMGRLYYSINDLGNFNKTTYSLAPSYCQTPATFGIHITSLDRIKSIVPESWTCYDQLGREIRSIIQSFASTQKTYQDIHYDFSGRNNETSVPYIGTAPTANIYWSKILYDELGRKMLSKEPQDDTQTTTYSYSYDINADKNKLTVTNARDHTTETYSNVLGQIKKITDASDNSTTYTYDSIGNQVTVDGPLSGIQDKITTTYDDFDHISKITDPDLGIWNYKYKASGQLDYQIDAENNCTKLSYDNLGRTIKKTYRTNANNNCTTGTIADTTSYTYNHTTAGNNYGLLATESNNNTSKTYSYDTLGRLQHLTTQIGSTTLSQTSYYDAYNRQLINFDATNTGTDGTLYHYNNQGYLEKTQGTNTSIYYQTIIAMDAFGNIKHQKAGNGIYTSSLYDLKGQVSNINTSYSASINASDIQGLSFQYDQVGNLKQRIDYRFDTMTEIFTYDELNRLNFVDYTVYPLGGTATSARTYAITYDAAGRRDTANGVTYSYANQHIHGVANTTDGKSYIYDAVGNQTNSAGRTLSYTAFNKVQTMSQGSYSSNYLYGTNNEKIKRSDININIGENKSTLYLGNTEVITDHNTNTTKYKRYVGNAIITKLAEQEIEVRYIHKDHLGSVQLITRQNSDNAFNRIHMSYDAFGKRRSVQDRLTFYSFYNPAEDTTDKGFTGQEHIDELNLIDYNARLYDPELGIMLQADTIIPDGHATQSLNRYAYVFNNPLSYTDPTGHVPQDGKRIPLYKPKDKKEFDKMKKYFESKGIKVHVVKGVQRGAFTGSDSGIFRGNGLGILANPESQQQSGFLDAVGGTLSGMARNMGNDLWDKTTMVAGAFNNTFLYPLTDAIGVVGDYTAQYDGMFNTLATMGPQGRAVGGLGFYGSKFLSGFGKVRGLIGGGNSVWDLNPLVRGNIIESTLAKTDYKGWFNVGAEHNGFFPLVDFQKGNTLVSMKSVDTNSSNWMNAMKNHIRDLSKGTSMVNNKVANMMLDIRVQPGGAKAAQQLIKFGERNNVRVMVQEF